MTESTQDEFACAAQTAARERVAGLRKIALADVLRLPEASAEDIVVAGKEVQLAVFRQTGVPDHPDATLLTVQISRAAMGGIVTYLHEKGVVFFSDGACRDATEEELVATRG